MSELRVDVKAHSEPLKFNLSFGYFANMLVKLYHEIPRMIQLGNFHWEILVTHMRILKNHANCSLTLFLKARFFPKSVFNYMLDSPKIDTFFIICRLVALFYV